MIKQVLKIIYAQRKSNGWLFAELLIVVGALWLMTDRLWVDLRTYYAPLGYDITGVWRFKLNRLSSSAPTYVPPSQYTSDEASDLRLLMTRIRRHPAVEEVCIAYYSCPYSYGSSWFSVSPLDGDTTGLQNLGFQLRRVSPEYFDVFRVKDKDGQPVSALIEGLESPLVISVDMEKRFYPGESGRGRRLRYGHEKVYKTVSAVCASVRAHEYERNEPCFYHCYTGTELDELIRHFSATSTEMCVRMKKNLSREEMNAWLAEMGEQLTVNNLYIYGVSSLEDMRAETLKSYQDASNRKLALMAFLLANVFFGIIGTFWLRTQYRQGEIGLRIALGASRQDIRRMMYAEGLCLLVLTLPFELIFAANMIYLDKVNTYLQPLSVLRFLVTFGGAYLLMAGMVCLGIWFPVRKAERLTPATALHEE